MKVQWFRSATVGIKTNSGTTILCDPWLTDGAFIGSWFHWPPLKNEYEEVLRMDWDYLYISHLHPDHFDRNFVSDLARENQKVKVIVPNFENQWLLRAITNCGFDSSRICVLEGSKEYYFGDLKVKVLTADYCDPLECGVSIPCETLSNQKSTIDSLAIFEADGQRILNANDALAVKSIERLWAKIGDVDLLMGHFGGAGPFPQCFKDIDDDLKISQSAATASIFIQRLGNAANKTHSKFVFPYAGQYVLGGRLYTLNKFRSVLSLDEVKQKLQEITTAEVITLDINAEFDLDRGEVSNSWVEPSEEVLDHYIQEIKTIKFPYELRKLKPLNFEASLEAAANKVLGIYGSSSEFFGAKNSTITLLSESHRMNLHFNGEKPHFTTQAELDSKSESHTLIELPDQLLYRIVLKRKDYKGFSQFHFNQAEIGSHLIWKRNGPYNNATKLLNFFHT